MLFKIKARGITGDQSAGIFYCQAKNRTGLIGTHCDAVWVWPAVAPEEGQ